MIDIVFPKNNEKEFIAMALNLGYSDICFCYELSDFKKINKIENNKITIHYAIIASPNKIQEAKKLSNFVITKSSDKNRSVFEHQRPDLIFSLEDAERSDFIFYRNSGMNQVYSKLAKKNDIIIGLSFDLLLNSKNRIKILGRMMLNIKLCRKYKVPIAMASFAKKPYVMRNPEDLSALGSVLGMSTKQAKECMDSILSKIKENEMVKRTGAKGIKVID